MWLQFAEIGDELTPSHCLPRGSGQGSETAMQLASVGVLDHATVGVKGLKGLMHRLLKSDASIDSDQCSPSEQCPFAERMYPIAPRMRPRCPI